MVFKRYKELALSKGYKGSEKKWGWKGALLYIGFSFGLQFLVGVLIGADVIYLDIEQLTNKIAMSLVSYGVGGIAAYVGYQKLASKEDKKPDINSFGDDSF